MEDSKNAKMILTGVMLGVLFWFLDSIIDAYVFNSGDIARQIFHPTPLELWIRLFVSGIILIFIFMFIQHRRAEEALQQSEEKYRMLIENIQDGVFIIQDAKLQYVNEAFARTAGYTSNEIIGKDFREFVAPEDLEMVADRYYRRQAGENVPSEYEFRVMRKDGTRVVVDMNAGLITYRGRVASIGILKDITGRKQIEEKLREGERFLESIFASIQDGIGILDKEMNIIRANPTAEKWYLHAVPFAGKKCYEAYHGRSERCEFCPAWRTLETGEAAYEVVPKHGSGGKEIGWLEIYSFPMIDTTTGQMTGVIEYVRDITGRKLAEKAISNYARKLEESNRMKELFTDIMHHDLLNPLSISRGYVELLREKETSPKKIADLEIIGKNLTKGMELIESATMLSKLESLERIEFEDMDLKDVIKKVIENLGSLAEKSGMKIENNVTQSMPVRANKIIEEVFNNFISNAVKYAAEGKRIAVDSEENKDSWRIKVIDFGEGVRDPDKAAIFERFQRMEKKGVKGSGLGLTIAKRIVELHNGRIWVEDNPAGGAVFVVDIPKST